uniref:Uncharacterized protein n=1 Tax=candidate division CPR3 bacterium TaxID=2268181 RepID=A0A7V3JA83_UNCC3
MKQLKILILVCFLFALTLKVSLAYYGDNKIESWENNVYGKPTQFNLQSSTNETFQNLIISVDEAVLGPTQEKYSNITGTGAIPVVVNLISELYANPPVSSREYFADLGRNFGIIKPAHAQAGIGFAGLSNLLPLWKASRNLAYIFFVIAFLYTGLAIMFRVKLDPKTVITIQNAIPKLVIALILVTFSYAIVGLMIDLIYVIIYVGVLVIGQTGWININAEQAKFANLSFGEGIGLIFGGGVEAFWEGILGLMGGALLVGLITGLVTTTGASLGLTAGAGAIILGLLAIVALFCIVKLFFALIQCYVQIIIAVIAGPIQIMMGALPGSQGGFGSWFKNLMANILVFPIVALALLVGWLLCGSHSPTWTPPVIASAAGMANSLIGFGMLLLVPKIPDMVKSAFKMKPAGYGAAIAEPLQAAYRVGLAGYKAVQEHYPPAVQMRAKKEGEYKAIVEKYQREKEGK